MMHGRKKTLNYVSFNFRNYRFDIFKVLLGVYNYEQYTQIQYRIFGISPKSNSPKRTFPV